MGFKYNWELGFQMRGLEHLKCIQQQQDIDLLQALPLGVILLLLVVLGRVDGKGQNRSGGRHRRGEER